MAERPQKEQSRDQQSRAGQLTEERGVTAHRTGPGQTARSGGRSHRRDTAIPEGAEKQKETQQDTSSLSLATREQGGLGNAAPC